MDSNSILPIILISYAIGLFIIHEIIKSATQSKKNIQLQEAQVKLLVSIALKLGVPKEDVLNDTKEL